MRARMKWDPWLPGLVSDSSEMQGRMVALLSTRDTSFSYSCNVNIFQFGLILIHSSSFFH